MTGRLSVVFDGVGIRDGGGVRLLELLVEHLPACRPQWHWAFFMLPETANSLDLGHASRKVEVFGVTGAGWLSRARWLTRGLGKVVRQRHADVVLSFANLPPTCSAAPVVIFLQQMKALQKPSSSRPGERLRLLLIRGYLRASFRFVARIVVQSTHMKVLLDKFLPGAARRTVVIPSPAASVASGGAGGHVLSVLADAGRPCVAYISLPRSHKNHLVLVRAFAHLRRSIPTASLLLTVPRPGKGDAVTASIHAAARDLGVADGIIWLGSITASEVAAVYGTVELAVFPSISESFGLPLAEALMQGCPVAASDLPFAHEILGDAGSYFDPADPVAMAGTMAVLLGDPPLLAEKRTASLARAHRFAPETAAEQLCAVLEDAAAGGRL
ncbi:glycosyltransferase family 1 protein [Emcibacter sp. SYSU 3D8]|uniref:glycosyltransferase family 4 protein n=1 Tax=Emcibacter sp. SYSU 3D8 TaxID=3133969 RepID=UPI0031FEF20C